MFFRRRKQEQEREARLERWERWSATYAADCERGLLNSAAPPWPEPPPGLGRLFQRGGLPQYVVATLLSPDIEMDERAAERVRVAIGHAIQDAYSYGRTDLPYWKAAK